MIVGNALRLLTVAGVASADVTAGGLSSLIDLTADRHLNGIAALDGIYRHMRLRYADAMYNWFYAECNATIRHHALVNGYCACACRP